MNLSRVIAALGTTSMSVMLIAGSATAASVDLDADKVEQIRYYVETQRHVAGLPGIAVGIVLDDQLVFSEGFGEATVGGEPMTPQHLVVIASLSKSITAMAVMVLVDEGSVDLDDSIATYLPELSSSGDLVSVRDVMHHRSGLSRRVGNDPFVGSLGETLTNNVSRLGGNFVAGSTFEYSNANYDTLALLVQRVSGVPYADFVKANIFDPIGMDASVVGSSAEAPLNLATGYYHNLFVGFRPHVPWMPDGMVGSYSTYSNVEDMAKYMMVHINGGRYGDQVIVSPESLAMLHKSAQWGPDSFPVGYGGGLNIYPGGEFTTASESGSYTQLVHDGSSPSYTSFLVIAPEAGTGVIVLANGRDDAFESAIPQLGSGVVDILFNGTPGAIAPLGGLDQWGKHLLFVLVLTQLVLSLAAIPSLRRVKGAGRSTVTGWALIAAATAAHIVAAYLLIVFIPESSDTRLSVIYSLPDHKVLLTFMGLGIAWGMAQILLATWWSVRNRQLHQPKPTTLTGG